jgi:GAF domain
MAGRITVLPDERLLALRPTVEVRMRQAAALLCSQGFDHCFDETMRRLLCEAFKNAGAHEGTVWVIDDGCTELIPRFNSGPNAARFIASFRQPLNVGMISTVAVTEQPLCENAVHEDSRQDKRIDLELGVRTWAMLAVPFRFAGELRGVVSCVQLRDGEDTGPPPPGFTLEHLHKLQAAVAVLSRLIDARLMSVVLGLEGSG